MRSHNAARFVGPALAILWLAGCSSCDGERGKPPASPKQPAGDASAAAIDASEPVQPGYLDVPAGALDPLFRSLDGAEHQQPTGRVLLTFFGDSHTAGDS